MFHAVQVLILLSGEFSAFFAYQVLYQMPISVVRSPLGCGAAVVVGACVCWDSV